VFNEDTSAMAPGEAFNVLVVHAASASAFVQTARPSNIVDNFTTISSSLTNGTPGAQVQVTQVWNPGGTVGGVYNNHTVGVYYTGSKWSVFNEDKTSMASGVSFNVMIGAGSSGGGTLLIQTATAGNSTSDYTLINSTKTNGDAHAVVFETPDWNPGGAGHDVYDTSPTGVFYAPSPRKNAVFNEDVSSMPRGAAFNLIMFSS
jgi:hypothetical protein